MIALARSVPLWLYACLALLGVVVYQRFEMASALRASGAARDAQFRNALQQIDAQRTATQQEQATLGAERAALQKQIADNRVALRALEGRSKAAGASTAQDEVAARALVAHPSCPALLEAAGRQGLKSLRCQ